MCESLFIKKKALEEVFSCEFCEIFENTFFIEYFPWLLLSSKVDSQKLAVFESLLQKINENLKRNFTN